MEDFLNGITWWFVLEKIVFFLFISLFFWGARIKIGKNNEYNEDYSDLVKIKSLRGLAAIGILIHHISREPIFQEEGIFPLLVNAGPYLVSIFFFCSGYGLLKSLDTKKDYLNGFIKKRIFMALVIPFYVNVLLYGLMIYIVKIPMEKEQWITNLLGITMMNTYAWFPIVLALLYLVFFISFRFIKNRTTCLSIIFAFIILMGIGACINGHFAWWAGSDNWWMTEESFENEFRWWKDQYIFWFQGEWWVNSAPAFFSGLLFSNYEKQIVGFFKKTYALKYLILLTITILLYMLSAFGQSKFGYWTEFNMNGPEIGTKIITFFCQVPLFFVFPLSIIIFMMKYNVSNPVLKFFGKYSLHTYLMNLAAITGLRFLEYPVLYDFGHGNLFLYGIAVLLLSTLMGVGEQILTGFIQKRLFAGTKQSV